MRLALALALVVMVTASGCTYELADTENTNMRGGLAERGGMAGLPSAPQKQGWSQSGNLTTGDPNGKVSLQANFAPDAGYYTVQFGVSGTVTGNSYRPVALCTFTVEGNNVVREIDVSDGATISGPGQAIRVQVTDDTSENPGQKYGVSIQVTPGTRPTTEQPPTLFGGRLNQTLGETSEEIPQNVGIISVFVTAIYVDGTGAVQPGPAPLVVQLFDGSSHLLSQFYAGLQGAWVPVPAGASFIEFQNFGAAGGTVNVAWTWGIDG